jgi:hypothetical protein
LSELVELEDTSTLGRSERVGEIDSIDDADEPGTERNASRERTQDVAEEPNSLSRIKLGCDYLLFPVTHRERGAAHSAKIAHPVDLAPGSPHPTPSRDFDYCQCRGAGEATLPAGYGDEPIRAKRNAASQEELKNCAEPPDPPRYASGADNSIAHFPSHPCVHSFGLPHR